MEPLWPLVYSKLKVTVTSTKGPLKNSRMKDHNGKALLLSFKVKQDKIYSECLVHNASYP